MIEQQNQEEALIQNLRDADCTPDAIELFMKCYEQEEISEQLRILTKHRGVLLDYVHDNQKKLDCLDFLIFKIKKGQTI
jgi:hypothetical protein